MSNVNKNKKNLADTVESKNKPISTNTNCTCSTPSSSECDTYCNVNWINSLYQNHRTKIKIFIAVVFLFFLIICSITVLQYILCVPKHQSNACSAEHNNSTPRRKTYSKTYISVQTQILRDDLFAELSEYV